MNCVSCDIRVYHLGGVVCVFSLGYSSASSRVTGACPVTTESDLIIMRVINNDVRTTTTNCLTMIDGLTAVVTLKCPVPD